MYNLKRGFFLFISILLTIYSLSGCSEKEDADPLESLTKPDVYKSNRTLKQIKTCGETEVFLKENVKSYIKRVFKEHREYYFYGYDVVAFDAAPTADGGAESNDSQPQHSETNVQEIGVDEADIVKTDGSYLYIANGKYFLIFKSWPADELSELARIEMDGNINEMFIENDMAVIFSYVYTYNDAEPYYYYGPSSMLKISIYDISDRSNPVIKRETKYEGTYMTSRRIENMVYVVTNSYINKISPYTLLQKEEFKNFSYDDLDNPLLETMMLAYVDSISIEEFLPKIFDAKYSSEESNPDFVPIVSCDDFYIPETPNGESIVSLISFDLNDVSGDIQYTSIVADYGTVYSSLDNIYLTCRNYRYWYWYEWTEDDGWSEKTYIHKFSLGDVPAYQASGEVEGYIVNSNAQFSMGEYNNYFRIATTSNAWSWEGTMSSNIFVMKEEDGSLVEAGKIQNIAPDESIYAARFMGDRGYIVTFRQIDPLFTVDLSDPENPEIKGELEMLGFSTYLHPLGENHLLGIGRNADAEGRVDGLQLAVYDVSDMENPTRTAFLKIGSGWNTYSQALYEHKAFQYYEPLGLLSIPMHHWSWDYNDDGFFNGAMLFKIETDSITEYGEINHDDIYTPTMGYWNYNRQVKRTAFIGDDEGYFIYTISGVGIKVNDADSLSTVVSSAALPNDWVDYLCVYEMF